MARDNSDADFQARLKRIKQGLGGGEPDGIWPNYIPPPSERPGNTIPIKRPLGGMKTSMKRTKRKTGYA